MKPFYGIRRTMQTIFVVAGAGAGLFGCGGSGSSGPSSIRFQQQQLIVNGALATDAVTGQSLRFVHVSPGAATGNGTIESPYGSLTQALTSAVAGDVLYVHAVAGAAPIGGFTVPAGVRVLSNAAFQRLNTQQAPQVLLPLSGKSTLPVVTGTVTLSSDSTLSGFNVIPTAGSGIVANNVTGSVTISDNTAQAAGPGASGIAVINTSGVASLTIARNIVSHGTNSGLLLESDNTAQITASVTDNTATGNVGSGLFFYVHGGQMTATITGNTTTLNQATVPQESGIRFGVFNSAQGNVTLSNNTSTGNVGNGLFVGFEGTSAVQATISNNITTNNTGNGIFFGANQNAHGTGTILANTSTGNKVNAAFAPFPTGNGIFIGAQVSGQATANVEGNQTNNNANDGIFGFVGNNGQENVTISKNQATTNTANGIEINAGLNGAPGTPANPGDAPQAVAQVVANVVQTNLGIVPPIGGGGIVIVGFNSAVIRTAVTSNQILGNATGAGAFGGMAIEALQKSQVFAGVRNNTFTRNQGANPAFTAASGVPPTVLGGALAGPAQLYLQLAGNTSDTPFVLFRVPNTTLAADIAQQAGPIIQPGVPASSLGGVAVP